MGNGTATGARLSQFLRRLSVPRRLRAFALGLALLVGSGTGGLSVPRVTAQVSAFPGIGTYSVTVNCSTCSATFYHTFFITTYDASDGHFSGTITNPQGSLIGYVAPRIPTSCAGNIWMQVAYDDGSGYEATLCGTFSAGDPLVVTGQGTDSDGQKLTFVMQPDSTSLTPFTVHGTDNIWGAGLTSAPDPGGKGGGTLPFEASIPHGTSSIYFSSVAGGVSYCTTCNLAGPNGVAPPGTCNCVGPVNIAPYGGLSGLIDRSLGFYLVGVFLRDGRQPPSPPPTLDFTNNHSFTSLQPMIGQVFYVGDGRTATGSGSAQRFVVPPGATNLYLGFPDANHWEGLPGYYGDNSGSVSGDLHLGVPSSPTPIANTTSTRVTCSPQSVQAGRAANCTVTVSDTSHASSWPTGTVEFTASGPATGRFDPDLPDNGGYGTVGGCTLGPADLGPPASGPGSCSVDFAPPRPGAYKLTASYRGDSDHQASTGIVALPAGVCKYSGLATSFWSGYFLATPAVCTTNNNGTSPKSTYPKFTGVMGTFKIPHLNPKAAARGATCPEYVQRSLGTRFRVSRTNSTLFCFQKSIWVGIGTGPGDSLVQAGIVMSWNGEDRHKRQEVALTAWSETYSTPTPCPGTGGLFGLGDATSAQCNFTALHIKPADRITVTITEIATNVWRMAVMDDTTGKGRYRDERASTKAGTVEAIVERQQGVFALAPTKNVAFTNVKYRYQKRWTNFFDVPKCMSVNVEECAIMQQIAMSYNSDYGDSTPSAPDAEQTGFTVADG